MNIKLHKDKVVINGETYVKVNNISNKSKKLLTGFDGEIYTERLDSYKDIPLGDKDTISETILKIIHNTGHCAARYIVFRHINLYKKAWEEVTNKLKKEGLI